MTQAMQKQILTYYVTSLQEELLNAMIELNSMSDTQVVSADDGGSYTLKVAIQKNI
jgi:hypothetical protein